ncbi:helix-turn-helix domain-containing protein [Ekhidna sp. To15]|uniref:helix-turn-helix domain-containing protein n=1 Tax=Ekhidna sp. To15 TaxID=3395267 RepID=UPI003F51B38B
MNIGGKITELRKQKDWSQADLAAKIEVSRVIVGKYERNEATPSIDVAKRIADAFEVSLDSLVGEGVNAQFDVWDIKRLQEIKQLDQGTQEKMWFFIDTVLRDSKAKKAYS